MGRFCIEKKLTNLANRKLFCGFYPPIFSFLESVFDRYRNIKCLSYMYVTAKIGLSCGKQKTNTEDYDPVVIPQPKSFGRINFVIEAAKQKL